MGVTNVSQWENWDPTVRRRALAAFRAQPAQVRHLWVCHECPTLVERDPGSTGYALCDRHKS